MRVPAAGVLVAGFLAVWVGFGSSDVPDEACPGLRETYGYTVEMQWWPPGTTRCEVTAPEGRIVGSETYVPWREWATVVLFALAVLVLRPRPLRLLASLALFVAGLAVYFIGPQPW